MQICPKRHVLMGDGCDTPQNKKQSPVRLISNCLGGLLSHSRISVKISHSPIRIERRTHRLGQECHCHWIHWPVCLTVHLLEPKKDATQSAISSRPPLVTVQRRISASSIQHPTSHAAWTRTRAVTTNGTHPDILSRLSPGPAPCLRRGALRPTSALLNTCR